MRSVMRTVYCLVSLLVLVAPLALAGPDCTDSFVVTFDGEVMTVHHLGAFYNCCPVFDYEISQESGEIRVREIEVEGLCDCYCCFNLQVAIEDLAPGTYTLTFTYWEFWENAWVDWSTQVEVPDAGQVDPPTVASFSNSGCLTVDADVTSWGALKRRYE